MYATKKDHATALAQEFPQATRKELVAIFKQSIPGISAGAASTYASAVRKEAQANLNHIEAMAEREVESDESIRDRLDERFDVIEDFAAASCRGDIRSLIVSGPAGLGKTYTVEKARDEYDPAETKSIMVKGMIRPTGLYLLLHEYRRKGNVIILDDADSIFNDVDALNLLKAALDTTAKRVISWRSETKMVDADGEPIDKSFEFEGTVIFISNLDFDREIEKGGKMSEHYVALQSRSFFIDCDMKTKRDYIVRIKQVVEGGMLRAKGIDAHAQKIILNFIEDNSEKFRELTLRLALKMADTWNMVNGDVKKFESRCKVTMFSPKHQ